MIFNLLFEDNEDIKSLKDHLDQKIIKLRKSNTDKESFKEVAKLYKEIINPWVDKYYLYNKEITENEEENLRNDILDLINIVNKISKND